MLTLDDAKLILRIDKQALDEELISQAGTFYEISSRYVEAVGNRDFLNNAYKEAVAAADLFFRKAATKSADKWTETRIASEVSSSDLVTAAKAKVLQASKEVDDWAALRDAFHQRSFMLRDLVQLYIAGYYAQEAVSAPRDVAAENARAQLAKKRSRRTTTSKTTR